MTRSPIRFALLSVAAAMWCFVLLANVSFSATDWPSHAIYPYAQINNICGSAGAWAAYWIRYAIGPGIYPILFFGFIFWGLVFTRNRVSDVWLRGIGLGLLAVSFAAVTHTLSGGGTLHGLPEGTGGVMGIASAHFLQLHFNNIGALLVLTCVMLVGLILAADDLVLRTPGMLSHALSRTRDAVPSNVLMRFKFPEMPKLPRLPDFITRDSVSIAIPRTTSIIEEDDTPVVLEKKIRKSPPPPTDKPNLKLVGASVDDGSPASEVVNPSSSKPVATVDISTVADDVVIAEPEVVIAAVPEIRKDIVVRLAGTQKPKQTAPPAPKELGDYQLPLWDCLVEAEHGFAEQQEAFVREKAAVLEQALREFNIEARVVEIDTGPVITMYEISLAPGTKVSAITALSNDIARALAAVSLRIVAPVPGKHTVGIEVPNAHKEKVRLKELMQLAPEATGKMVIPLYLGKDASGNPLICDLAATPHCLIAGTTGSGKSVCINSIIMSIMYTQRPDMVKMILVDPKVVEMAPFRDIPHLMCPVITETAKATSVLEWACTKMDERYELLAEAGVRNIRDYNSMTWDELKERFSVTTIEEEAKIPKKMAYVVIIVDELADLMMTSGKEVESHIVRIAQKARAVGIHLVLATQRPQATVVTGLIKANMPTKIAFRVASKMDSRIVLDQNGADLLLGHGDMLFLPNGASRPSRGQGTYIDDKEIRDSVKIVKSLAEAQYEPELVQIRTTGAVDEEAAKDPLFDDAVRVVLETKRGSVSLLQRRLTIGYSRASRLIEAMAAAGIVGEYKGSQAREAAITLDEWDAIKAQQQRDTHDGMSE
jgi:DNA segregation ATPase FtsK/SpoIIIE, S-DNA-T family